MPDIVSMPPGVAELRIEGSATDTHSVPADVLIRALAGLQGTALVLAVAHEGKVVRERLKVSAEFRQRYSVRCGIPATGSYTIPLSLGPQQQQLALLDDAQPAHIFQQIYGLLGAIVHDQLAAVTAMLPDSRLRDRTLRELAVCLPKAGEQWELGFAVGDSPEVRVDSQAARRTETWILEPERLDEVMTVTGDLIRIDFSEHKIVIRYAPTQRELECVYLPDIEDTIIESRRMPIQVTGRFLLGVDGHPQRLTDVSRIEAVDLSPMIFDHLDYRDRLFIFQPPLELSPQLDEESGQLYVASDEPLGLHVYAQTRDQLVSELAAQTAFLWDDYAQEAPERLTEGAALLRAALRQRISVPEGMLR